MNERVQADREWIRRKGLHEFVRQAWHLLESRPFVDNWHIGAVCEFLTGLWLRQIRYGIINEPPGCMKSLLVDVFYPAWVWTLEDRPEYMQYLGPGATEKFIYATYADLLAVRDAKKMRAIVESTWYQDRWGDRCRTSSGSRQAKLFENDRSGWRWSTTTGGQVTGSHANQLFFDDPIKAQDAAGGAEATRVRLDAAWEFWGGTMSTRMSDPVTTVRCMIMQRLHDADPAGRAIASGEVDAHLMLPMRYEPNRRCSIEVRGLKIEDKRTEEGELLWPERFPEEVVDGLEKSLNVHAPAQLQQDPVQAGGNIFKAEWFCRFWTFDGTCAAAEPGQIIARLPRPEEVTDSLLSWDCTFKDSEGTDMVAGGAWLARGPDYYLREQVAERMSFTDTIGEMRAQAVRNPTIITKLVEDKANGPACVNLLKLELSGLEEVTPEGGKVARANAVAHLFRTGNVYLPHPSMPGFAWVNDYIRQHVRFPRATNDDMVDETSQALTRLHANSTGGLLEWGRSLAAQRHEQATRGSGMQEWIAFRPWATSPAAISKLDADLRRLPCRAFLLQGDETYTVQDGWYYVVTENKAFTLEWLGEHVREIG